MHETIFSYYFNLVIYNRIGLIAMRNEQHRYLYLSHQHKCEESEVLDHITRQTKVISYGKTVRHLCTNSGIPFSVHFVINIENWRCQE